MMHGVEGGAEGVPAVCCGGDEPAPRAVLGWGALCTQLLILVHTR